MASVKKSLDSPEETRPFDKGKVELAEVGGQKIGRGTLQPGWKWSESVKPLVGTESCQVHHVGYVVSGRLHVTLEDGTEVDLAPGDVYEIEPGHDAWVTGDEAFVGVEFQSLADYAKR